MKSRTHRDFDLLQVNACMISSGICCILGLVTACLVTNKNVESQTPDPGAQLSQMYNTQVSPVLTVSVLDMDVTTGRSTFLPLIGYPVNHDFNLQVGENSFEAASRTLAETSVPELCFKFSSVGVS